MRSLMDFGWTKANQLAWDAIGVGGVRPARVIADFGTSLKVATPDIVTAELSGRLAHYTRRDEAPKVGDWVAVAVSENHNVTIEKVVLRSNEVSRKVTGRRTKKQIIAANIDIAFVLLALDNDFSVERLKRFLYQLSVSSIETVIVLNKVDKTDNLKFYVEQIESINVPIIVTSALTGSGVESILERILPTKTAILLGSSGVGKSTLTNILLGRDIQATNTVRESDDTGQHTTVHRELFILPNGGILIDTPGIRELQLWGTEDELDVSYDDIAMLASQCKYSNCRHGSELGCSVNVALASGELDAKHYAGFVKMKQELSELATKSAEQIRQSNKRATRQNKSKLKDDYEVVEEY